MLRYSIPALILFLLAYEASAQIRIDSRFRRVPTADMRVVRFGTFRDTVRLSKRTYYSVDKAAYRHYVDQVIRDSIKVPIAKNEDWVQFNEAWRKLKETFILDPYQNVRAYVDTSVDFKSADLVGSASSTIYKIYPSQVSLQQLTFNIKLANTLLNQPMDRKQDASLFNDVLANTEKLAGLIAIRASIMYKISGELRADIVFTVFDKNGLQLNNVQCYLISPYTCRQIACKSCTQIPVTCEDRQVSDIVGKQDGVFDCANPVPENISFGYYLVFVISENKVIYFGNVELDMSNSQPGTPTPIKINIQ